MNELQGHMQYYTVGCQVKTMTGSIKMGTWAMVWCIVWESPKNQMLDNLANSKDALTNM